MQNDKLKKQSSNVEASDLNKVLIDLAETLDTMSEEEREALDKELDVAIQELLKVDAKITDLQNV